MKNLLFALIGLVFFASCNKKVAEVQLPERQKSEAEKIEAKLQPLTQQYVSDLSAKDSVSFFQKTFFFNSTAIDLGLLISDKEKPFNVDEKGIAHKTPTNIDILKTIPMMTVGKVIEERFDKRNPSVITAVLVAFDVYDKTYHLKFFRQQNELFLLSAKATLTYNGQTYQVFATIPEDKDCALLFYGDETLNTITIRESAKGFVVSSKSNSSSSTPYVETKEVNDEW